MIKISNNVYILLNLQTIQVRNIYTYIQIYIHKAISENKQGFCRVLFIVFCDSYILPKENLQYTLYKLPFP